MWKGANPFTEMYSGLKAEVQVPGDPTTAMNTALVARLLRAERVLVGGEAMSHCVNYTVRDLVEQWPAERRAQVASRPPALAGMKLRPSRLPPRPLPLPQIVVLTDGASAVVGFEAAAEEFLKDMAAQGCTLCTCAEVAAL